MSIDLITFITMVIIGILFNPMNALAYKLNHLYLSLTLFYGGLLMASNMIWAHELIHYISMGHINIKTFIIGILLSIIIVLVLLRNQLFINDNEYLKRMISHHSTALTTSYIINKKTKDKKIKELSNNIINTQLKEIEIMKNLLK